MHPEDLLRRFQGRMAIVDALGYASIDCYALMAADAKILCEVPISEALATGLRELSDDFDDLQRGILLWIASNRKQGEE